MINAIVAVGHDGVIGVDGTIPWCSVEDRWRFYSLTVDHTVVMGRRTFESIGSKPLRERKNIVISSSLGNHTPGVEVRPSVRLEAFKEEFENDLCWVIGGAGIYHMFEPIIHEWFVTYVNYTLPTEEGKLVTRYYPPYWANTRTFYEEID